MSDKPFKFLTTSKVKSMSNIFSDNQFKSESSMTNEENRSLYKSQKLNIKKENINLKKDKENREIYIKSNGLNFYNQSKLYCISRNNKQFLTNNLSKMNCSNSSSNTNNNISKIKSMLSCFKNDNSFKKIKIREIKCINKIRSGTTDTRFDTSSYNETISVNDLYKLKKTIDFNPHSSSSQKLITLPTNKILKEKISQNDSIIKNKKSLFAINNFLKNKYYSDVDNEFDRKLDNNNFFHDYSIKKKIIEMQKIGIFWKGIFQYCLPIINTEKYKVVKNYLNKGKSIKREENNIDIFLKKSRYNRLKFKQNFLNRNNSCIANKSRNIKPGFQSLYNGEYFKYKTINPIKINSQQYINPESIYKTSNDY